MTQHDMDIANQAGAAFRSDLNNALLALVSNNSGASAPATTFAYMWWADTSTGILKQRNAANSAWINKGLMATAIADPVYGRVVRTAGNLTTSSTSLVDVTGATVTFTTGANPIMVGFDASTYADSPGTNVYINVDIDGTLGFGTAGKLFTQRTANDYTYHGFTYQSAALSAGSHTAKAQWSVSAGTGTMTAGSSISTVFWAFEVR